MMSSRKPTRDDGPGPGDRRLALWTRAIIAVSLVQMLAVLMFLPAFVPGFVVDAASKQTLFTLVTAVVFFFIGRTTDTTPGATAIDRAPDEPEPYSGPDRRSGEDRRRHSRGTRERRRFKPRTPAPPRANRRKDP